MLNQNNKKIFSNPYQVNRFIKGNRLHRLIEQYQLIIIRLIKSALTNNNNNNFNLYIHNFIKIFFLQIDHFYKKEKGHI